MRVVASAGGADEEAIASALFADRRLVFPDAGGKHCWFAARVYMRSRMMRAPESGCERWGSLMHNLWDANAGWKPHRIVSRLLMREAGLDGAGDDNEATVNELALVLTGTMRKNPFPVGKSAKVPRHGDPVAADLVVRRALRETPISQHSWEEAACPSALLPSAARAVSEAQRLGSRGAMVALPAFAEDVRSTRKGRAGSTLREALAAWMASPDGQEWRRDKEALFPGAARASG